ncbi:putative chromatin regulator PHD family [Lupinus albus]|uniref:Putative chromatin regulator PHD family n=1 Tax=Lupinus albus TaxID=3870 RepID=A0A6A4NTA3_LUPAL|nr:putative chromatin regulator PHD family [Lupinus albus]
MPKTKPMDIISYVTIRGTNKVVRVGDCVLMRSVDGSNRLRVAQVEWIDQDDDYNMNVHLIWYCKPEESYGGRRQFHGARELFLTDQYSAQSADTIHGKCNVHSFENYNELRNINAWDYYSRFHYSVSTGVFTPDQIRVYCKCELPQNPDEFMLQCKVCKDWFHPLCVGLSIGYARRLENYVCSECPSDEA